MERYRSLQLTLAQLKSLCIMQGLFCCLHFIYKSVTK
uniref:60S ribosomal protein L13-A n=1 Tax=virus sp. ctxZT69 TaxID=2826818 RepID=A0A8S5R6V9_9VIRU|nr:MAG TPA: 60S ribosomal protein L13-A [virus sp. ctxZT69]